MLILQYHNQKINLLLILQIIMLTFTYLLVLKQNNQLKTMVLKIIIPKRL